MLITEYKYSLNDIEMLIPYERDLILDIIQDQATPEPSFEAPED